jgi:hypothetical protein
MQARSLHARSPVLGALSRALLCLLAGSLLGACVRAEARPFAADRLWGVTVDDVSDVEAIEASLAGLAKKPTARIVFDPYVPAARYLDALGTLHRVSGVMGELLDSSASYRYTPAQYATRVQDYLSTLGDRVDIWEVANEVNGEWSCAENASRCTSAETADVVAKMTTAYAEVKSRGKTAALTLYYNDGCFGDPANEVFQWAAANVPEPMKEGLDYVLLSYYEDDCNGLTPDWPAVFTELGKMFPNSKVGFGECGTSVAARKATDVSWYYRMAVPVPRFIGGYFWWYFRRDMVPSSTSLWSVLDAAIAGR